MTTLLDVKNLSTIFETKDGIVPAVNNISFKVDEGETLGIVGESGSGKSVSMLSILRSIQEPPGKITEGEIFFSGYDLRKLEKEQMRKIRGSEISLIPQDPMTFLNPIMTIGYQIAEPLIEHKGLEKQKALKHAIDLLDTVGIPDATVNINNYPFQFSGGMRQRVMIAMALACKPKLLIADEPTTALDVTISAQIINLVKELQKRINMTIIWITHDLGVIARLAKWVMVMYAGMILERSLVKTLYSRPMHPYTIGLLNSIPRLDDVIGKKLSPIAGQPPKFIGRIYGCPFAPRCSYKKDRCLVETPSLLRIEDDHEVACWELKRIREEKNYA